MTQEDQILKCQHVPARNTSLDKFGAEIKLWIILPQVIDAVRKKSSGAGRVHNSVYTVDPSVDLHKIQVIEKVRFR